MSLLPCALDAGDAQFDESTFYMQMGLMLFNTLEGSAAWEIFLIRWWDVPGVFEHGNTRLWVDGHVDVNTDVRGQVFSDAPSYVRTCACMHLCVDVHLQQLRITLNTLSTS